MLECLDQFTCSFEFDEQNFEVERAEYLGRAMKLLSTGAIIALAITIITFVYVSDVGFPPLAMNLLWGSCAAVNIFLAYLAFLQVRTMQNIDTFQKSLEK